MKWTSRPTHTDFFPGLVPDGSGNQMKKTKNEESLEQHLKNVSSGEIENVNYIVKDTINIDELAPALPMLLTNMYKKVTGNFHAENVTSDVYYSWCKKGSMEGVYECETHVEIKRKN